MNDFTGDVYWITGLSGSGKTTLSIELVKTFRAQNKNIVFLDGDTLREILGVVDKTDIYHGREARLAIAYKYSELCKLLSDQGLTVVIATISLFHEIHEWNRLNLKNYHEIYLKVPISELRRRDPKGIYRRHSAGEIQNVAGLDFQVDEPLHPSITFEFPNNCSVKKMAEQISKIKQERSTK